MRRSPVIRLVSQKGRVLSVRGQPWIVTSLLVLLLFAAGEARAQQSPRSIVNPAGESHTSQRSSLSWTLGDIAAGYYLTPEIQYREGFQSTPLRVTGVDPLPLAWDVNVYPNPTDAVLTVAFGEEHPACVLRLHDLTGRELQQIDAAANAQRLELRLDDLPAGSYLLRIQDIHGERNATYQIRKTR